MELKTQHGYLVLADISGYTSYLAGTELEHAHEILTALLETIVGHFQTRLTIAKLEGDAVFAYAPVTSLSRGETLLELIEATYVAFRDHVEAAHRRTTCECNACRNIPSLDLKFLTHCGDYIVQNVAGISELVGSDVNLVHRLLKNQVATATGWRAYALFTETGLKQIGAAGTGLHQQPEAYEHLGQVQTYSLNLRQRYQEIKDAQRVFLSAAEADLAYVYELAAPPAVLWDWYNEPRRRPPAVLWDWYNEPRRRVQWSSFDTLRWTLGADGRTRAGTQSHCVHGKKLLNTETFLDWRPFDYFTCVSTTGPMLATFQFEPIQAGRGTRVHIHMKVQLPLPAFVRRPMFAAMMKPQLQAGLDKLAALLADEQRAQAQLESG